MLEKGIQIVGHQVENLLGVFPLGGFTYSIFRNPSEVVLKEYRAGELGAGDDIEDIEMVGLDKNKKTDFLQGGIEDFLEARLAVPEEGLEVFLERKLVEKFSHERNCFHFIFAEDSLRDPQLSADAIEFPDEETLMF